MIARRVAAGVLGLGLGLAGLAVFSPVDPVAWAPPAPFAGAQDSPALRTSQRAR